MAISAHKLELLYVSGVKIIDAFDGIEPVLEMDNALKVVFPSHLRRSVELATLTCSIASNYWWQQ